MAESIKIAVAGKDGGSVNEHFGQAAAFLIYEMDDQEARLTESRAIADHAQEGEDRRDTIQRMLADCAGLLVARIGPVPKEKMAKAGIDARDDWAEQPVSAALTAFWTARNKSASSGMEEVLPPADPSRFRLLHCMLRVEDMERSLDFYTRLLGLSVLERREHKKNQFTQVYLGYPSGGMTLELVQNWSQDSDYQKGEGFGHFAIAVNGIGSFCKMLEAEGIPMPRPPRSQRHGENIVAFIEDPDGYRIELVQYAQSFEQTSQETAA